MTISKDFPNIVGPGLAPDEVHGLHFTQYRKYWL